jgi:2-isopropylmalate synthase
VPSHYFGMEQIIEIGPMSGKSNVHFWLEKHGIPDTPELVERIFQRAKNSATMMTEAEILECCRAAGVNASIAS